MIYVIDDDFDVLKSLRFLLETEGFDVRTFRSGTALLGSRIRNDADCLIVDYKMAGMDGMARREIQPALRPACDGLPSRRWPEPARCARRLCPRARLTSRLGIDATLASRQRLLGSMA